MAQHDLSEVSIEQRGCKVRVRRGARLAMPPAIAASPAVAAAPATAPATSSPGGTAAVDEGLVEVSSPMVGTFYRAPSPESDPFVEVGDRVEPDTVLCIIEAMKVMNEIKAEVAGTVEEILVANGEAVEFGQPLFRIRKSE
ncbi:MAG: acetyl-CoA carboxylase biotin carboxyl carrier protein [Planctomycetota bacterium]|nr:MAG: acetyl-CoA carboxylase biotin carboxyl carrier protein [Planctomycetota bacterium]